jgi:hypothetical protein
MPTTLKINFRTKIQQHGCISFNFPSKGELGHYNSLGVMEWKNLEKDVIQMS